MGRMEYVIKTYWGKSVGKGDNKFSLNCIVLDTFEIAISLVGAEASVIPPNQVVTHDFGSLQDVGFRTNEQNIERIQNMLDVEKHRRFTTTEALRRVAADRLRVAEKAVKVLARVGQPYKYDERGLIHWNSEDWGLAELALHVSWLPEHSPADFLIPWVARELSRLAKASVEAMSHSAPAAWREFRKDYSEACDLLKSKAPAIAQWSKETKVDVGRIDLAQALEAIATYTFKTSFAEQGTVIYRFDDGWTVQELRTERALDQEGENMQNCVGGYCHDVEEWSTRIYSIRDAGGQPHVTMELKMPRGPRTPAIVKPAYRGAGLSPEAFVASPERLLGYFAQILGKQNDAPTAEYRARAREFVDKVFDKEGLGWCITGGDVRLARFAGRHMEDVNFPEIFGTNHIGEYVFVLADVDFRGANLTGSKFNGLRLTNANFEKARLSNVDFNGCDLIGAKFDEAQCHFTLFRYTNMQRSSFVGAHAGAASFVGASMMGATFRSARVDGANFENTKGGDTADWTGVDLTAHQRHLLDLPSR